MFGTFYWVIVFINVVCILYMWIWFKENRVKSRDKKPIASKLVRWLLLFVPILNIFFAFCFALLVIMTFLDEEVVMESIRESETLYFEE